MLITHTRFVGAWVMPDSQLSRCVMVLLHTHGLQVPVQMPHSLLEAVTLCEAEPSVEHGLLS